MSRAESPAKQPMETFQEFPSRALAMNRIAISGGKPPDIRKGVIVFVLTLTAMLFLPGHAHAQDASRVLKAMSDYLTGQKTISMTFDSEIEVITSELQKIQFTSSGQVLLNRPDKLRATRTGGYADVEFVFDGKTAAVLGKHLNAFAQADAPGSVDQLIDHLRRDSNLAGAATREAGVTQSPVMRNPYVAGGAATSYAGVARQSIIRNPYVAGAAAAGVATAGVYTDCEQTTDEYGNVSTQC